MYRMGGSTICRLICAMARCHYFALTVAEITQVDQWYAAGFTSSDIGVAVIDHDLRDFRTRVADPTVELLLAH